MPPDSVWSDRFNKPEIQLNLSGTGWKNLMNKCLLETEISKGSESQNVLSLDPNVVMNVRHEMVKKSSMVFPRSQEQIQTDALKLLREDLHNRVLRQKEGKLVETEIVKLIRSLENHRLTIKKKLEETEEKTRASHSGVRVSQHYRKLAKGLGHCEADCRRVGRMGCSVEVDVGSEMIKPVQEKMEERDEVVSFRKGSLEGSEKEYWEEDEGKGEIMKRFLEDEWKSAEQGSELDMKKEVRIGPVQEVQNRMKESSIGCVLKTWKSNGNLKSRRAEGKIYKKKIEEFLVRLGERKEKEKIGSERRRKMLEKKEKDEKTDKTLQKLMQEVKASEKEAQEKLQRVRIKAEVESKFLVRMEERRKERAKRRSEFEERKLKLEKEKEKLELERKEEERLKDEEEKRKRLEEIKEKRRMEKEKREEEKREREKQRVNMGVAVAHYKVYLALAYGMRPWLSLMRMRERQWEEAERFFERRLKEKTLRGWMGSAREESERKISCAVAFYEETLKRACLRVWMESHKTSQKQNQVAVDWHELRITEKTFKKWRGFTKIEQSEANIKRDMAVTHYERKLKRKCMLKLLEYPELRKLEQAKENRKWKWRQKVREILPDYEPIDISDYL